MGKELRQLAQTLGLGERVIWAGARRDIASVHSACDISSSSSSFGEGFSNTLGEAMACGRLCVATDVGDTREILGDHGVIAPPRNPAAFARALAALCRDINGGTPFSEAARQRILDNFSLEQLVERSEAALLAIPIARQ